MNNQIVSGLFEVSSKHLWESWMSARARNALYVQHHSRSWPEEKSTTSPTRTLMTPRNPWSFFLNFFWSKIWTANMLSSEARLIPYQWGFIFEDDLCSQVETFVPVRVQCPLDNSRCLRLFAAQSRHCEWIWKSCRAVSVQGFPMGEGQHTENIALVQSISGNYYLEVRSDGLKRSIKGWQTS